MANLLISYRYFFLALFVVLNAVTCSVAVWNYSIAQALLLSAKVDVFLAVISGLAILFVIPIMFVDAFRKNALTGRVWFELAWSGLFWVLHLCGASAFTALVPDDMCSPLAVGLVPYSCTSSRVLQAFSWLCSILLLFHLITLFVCSLLHYDDDKTIWNAGIRFYPWFETRSTLGSAPSSPTTKTAPAPTTWQRKPFNLSTSKKLKRASRPADLDLEKGERTNVQQGAMMQTSRTMTSAANQGAPSLYPSHVAATMTSAPLELPSSKTPKSASKRQHQDVPRSHRKAAPKEIAAHIPTVSSPLTAPAQSDMDEMSSRRPPVPKSAAPVSGRGSPTRRGPPPPLDLARISAYNAIEERRKKQQQQLR
ncbi:hypothetical protein BXZ70DRAFT_1003647 [Cristinia sonorae]|uniref:Uncharacterized protein n=1 Tax=Cristinia sonorae TaxID=1940300 RepID=A0A8K0UX23_9AGAR|nr:hypothetical protein BXZ70DRAFT_1003647 [Cristinia sonorae]